MRSETGAPGVRPVPGVAIVTSRRPVPARDVVEANQITLVSLYINWAGERTEREADITDISGFMEELRSASLPTTSQPSVGDFVTAYEPLLADGGDVVPIHISGGISGTVEAAATQARARRKGGERRRRHGPAGARGLRSAGPAGLGAGRGPQSGRGQRRIGGPRPGGPRREHVVAIDDARVPQAGGRIGGAAAFIGTTLRIKPILTLEAEITPVERVRTKRAFGGWSTTRASARSRAPTARWCSTSGRPTRPSAWSTPAARCTARPGLRVGDRPWAGGAHRPAGSRREAQLAGPSLTDDCVAVNRPMPAMPPPTMKPAAAAPISASWRCSESCFFQSVSSTILALQVAQRELELAARLLHRQADFLRASPQSASPPRGRLPVALASSIAIRRGRRALLISRTPIRTSAMVSHQEQQRHDAVAAHG